MEHGEFGKVFKVHLWKVHQRSGLEGIDSMFPERRRQQVDMRVTDSDREVNVLA
jgi:hypothetical protein